MNLWRLLRARLRQDLRRILTALIAAALASGVLIVSLAERLGGDLAWTLPIGAEATMLLLSAATLGRIWAGQRIATGLASTTRQIRRTLLTTWIGLEPGARAAIDGRMVATALSDTPRGLVQLGTAWPGVAFSFLTTLACFAATLFAVPAAGAALVLAVKLTALARVAQLVRAGRAKAGGIDAAEARPPGPERPRHDAWRTTGDALSVGARPALAILLAVVSQLSDASPGETATVVLIAFLLPLEWMEAIPMIAGLAAAADRLAAAESEMASAAAQWPTPAPAVTTSPFGTLDLVDCALRYAPHPGLPGAVVGPLTCCLASGGITMILGGSGSGKSSALRMLAGIERPATGRVLLNGIEVDPFACRHLVRLVSTDPLVLAGQVVADAGRPEILALIDLLELGEVIDPRAARIPDTAALSIAVRARLGLLLAFASESPVLLLDEPGLWQSPAMRQTLFGTVLPRLRDAGRTVAFTTTDERLADLADTLVRLESGRQAAA